MPTGYTAAIKDGISFNNYTMSCAKAFGALSLMRDLPANAEIPKELEANDYHKHVLDAAEAELSRLESLSSIDASKLSVEEWEDKNRQRLVYLADNIELRKKYNEMLIKVNEWVVPTEEHKALHKFMRTQIEDSINWDCQESTYSLPEERLSGSEWLTKKKLRIAHDIEYHTKMYKEEIKRTLARNIWIKNLLDSLKLPSKPLV